LGKNLHGPCPFLGYVSDYFSVKFNGNFAVHWMS
jgi:hypothetical protein